MTENTQKEKFLTDKTDLRRKFQYAIAFWLDVGKQKKVGFQDGQANSSPLLSIIEY
jgi:hypothetical protein